VDATFRPRQKIPTWSILNLCAAAVAPPSHHNQSKKVCMTKSHWLATGRRASVVFVLATVVGLCAHAQTPNNNFERSERCSKDAGKYYAREFASRPVASEYVAHYSRSQDGCFIQVKLYVVDAHRVSHQEYWLRDVLENRIVGLYVELQGTEPMCNVNNRSCTNLSDYEALTTPYLKD